MILFVVNVCVTVMTQNDTLSDFFLNTRPTVSVQFVTYSELFIVVGMVKG